MFEEAFFLAASLSGRGILFKPVSRDVLERLWPETFPIFKERINIMPLSKM